MKLTKSDLQAICGSERSEYGNLAIWFVHKRSDISLITHSGGNLKKTCLCQIKINIFDNILSENVLRTIRKGKVNIQSEVGEEILYGITTELQVFIWRSISLLPLLNYITVKPNNKQLIDLKSIFDKTWHLHSTANCRVDIIPAGWPNVVFFATGSGLGLKNI